VAENPVPARRHPRYNPLPGMRMLSRTALWRRMPGSSAWWGAATFPRLRLARL
jgi:hypothetical protein